MERDSNNLCSRAGGELNQSSPKLTARQRYVDEQNLVYRQMCRGPESGLKIFGAGYASLALRGMLDGKRFAKLRAVQFGEPARRRKLVRVAQKPGAIIDLWQEDREQTDDRHE
jgi:hypothetical protein